MSNISIDLLSETIGRLRDFFSLKSVLLFSCRHKAINKKNGSDTTFFKFTQRMGVIPTFSNLHSLPNFLQSGQNSVKSNDRQNILHYVCLREVLPAS